MSRSKLIELFTRVITPQDRKDKIYCNGADNMYPERVERVINNSVTAKLCANKTANFLLGLGFDPKYNDVIVNPIKKLTLYDILKRISDDFSYHKGAFIHVNYDVDGIPNYIDVLRYKNCRISQEDDYGSAGYVWHSKEWDDSTNVLTRTKKNKSWYYAYNPKIGIINKQRVNDAPKNATTEDVLRSYRGQVFFLNFEDRSIYPNSPIDAAYNDADTEHRISIFRNNHVKNGFQGANIVLLPYSQDEKDGLITDEQLKGLLGAENSSNLLKVEVVVEGDKKLSDYIHIETVKSEVDSDQFQYDEQMIQENIINSYEVPKVLVKGSEGALIGTNGDTLEVYEEILNRNTKSQRMFIEQGLNTIFENHPEINELKIVTLVDDTQPKEVSNNQNLEDGGVDN